MSSLYRVRNATDPELLSYLDIYSGPTLPFRTDVVTAPCCYGTMLLQHHAVTTPKIRCCNSTML